MPDALRPFVSRYAAIVVAYIAGWLTVKYGITLPPELRELLADSLTGIALFMVTYVTAHRVIDKRVNPADTASSHLAVEGKQEAHMLKLEAEAMVASRRFGAANPLEEPQRRWHPADED